MASLLPREIRKLKSGKIPESMENNPFIIVRHLVKFIFGDESDWEYLIVRDNNRRNDTVIDKKTAFQIIETNKMELAHSKSFGNLYELPGAPFHEKYAKKAAIKEKERKTRGRKPKTSVNRIPVMYASPA